ncbi:histidinol-phosphate transaminase [Tindallia californiensis]|uniref:Histidinol-phosphate aminotransferase n=1 Tax=Tindallia californiensis TaxID=159292 RepID=A0A1H3MKU8_9FIRM|nr:histidinol-phosphate transaminase [Tindallia californiensis]SDY77180.1 histidinol phosphate aminotransferase apoenzyme [Tindallia californiensis]
MEKRKKVNIKQLLRKNIQKLEPYQVIAEVPAIKLDANENNWLAGCFQERLAEKIKNIPLHQYPDTNCLELRQKLAAVHGIKEENVLTGVGSDQIIAWLVQAFVGSEDRVTTMNPTFGMYGINTMMVGGKLIEIPLDEELQFQPEIFLKSILEEKPKLVFITNPNNPTGGVIEDYLLNKLLEEIPEDVVIVADEAYYEFYGKTLANRIAEHQNLIVLRTLSKAYGLAGARVGYALASQTMIDAVSRVKPPYHMSCLDQAAGLVCLDMMSEVKESLVNTVKWRQYLETFFSQLKQQGKDKTLKVFPSYTNFILLKTVHAEGLIEKLQENEISVRGYGKEGILANSLRVTVGTEVENRKLQQVIDAYYG